jgi:hypothetical protein
MQWPPQGVRTRIEAMNPDMKRLIELRARELWQADGEPVGCDLEYWLRAEQEIVNQSVAGEEDPLAAVDQGAL